MTYRKKINIDQVEALQTGLDAKSSISSIVNDLTTGGTAVPLSAEQGKILKTEVDSIGGLSTVAITISSTELKAINTTPKTLVSAQGADTLIVIESIAFRYNFGTVRYQNELKDSGTTDGTATNKLIDSTQDFLTSLAGTDSYLLHNTTDDTYTNVFTKDSDTQLSINDDIMTSGENYNIFTDPVEDSLIVKMDIFNTVSQSIFLADKTTSFNGFLVPQSINSSSADVINTPVVLTTNIADLSVGDGTLDIIVKYSVITF